jgi:hypothetical protein
MFDPARLRAEPAQQPDAEQRFYRAEPLLDRRAGDRRADELLVVLAHRARDLAAYLVVEEVERALEHALEHGAPTHGGLVRFIHYTHQSEERGRNRSGRPGQCCVTASVAAWIDSRHSSGRSSLSA